MTSLSPDQLAFARRAASSHGFQVRNGRALPGGRINRTWLIETSLGARILRSYPPTRRARQVEFEMSVLSYLSARGHRVPTPMRDSRGAAVGTQDGRVFVWLLAIDANPLSATDVPTPTVSELAALMRPLVQNLEHFNPPFRPVAESRVIEQRVLALFDSLESAGKIALAQELRTRFRRLELWERERALPSGVVHGDLRPENLLRSADGRLWLVDFDDAHVGSRALDWVQCALEFSFDGAGDLDLNRYEHLLEALTPVHATAEERSGLPFLREILLLKSAASEANLGTLHPDNRYLRALGRLSLDPNS